MVNGVEYCSIEHMRASTALAPSQSQPSWSSTTPVAGPRVGCLIHNCCEEDSITDTELFVAAGDQLLGGAVFVSYGCHPHYYMDYGDEFEAKLLEAMRRSGSKVVAWGECGLDYFKNFYDVPDPKKHAQMVEVFARQARLAAKLKLPLIVHSRDAEEDTMTVLRSTLPREQGVHIHAFQGSVNMMNQVLDSFPNAVIGISGAIAMKYKNPNVLALAEQCPLDKLVLETDAPFLSEDPNDIPRIARAVARVRGLSTAEVLAASHRNCLRFYGLTERFAAK